MAGGTLTALKVAKAKKPGMYGGGGAALSNMAMLELLQGMGFGEDVTVHGFRSTFKDWCWEQTGYPNQMSEMALAHSVSDKVEAAYRRGDMREKRRRLMADWAAYCESPSLSRGAPNPASLDARYPGGGARI
ncbi:tyrosine-type recombinase/integrase [Bradyrhizobium sp. HKCCYLRH2060]|uniref:tyrosine-type recombinase/integrase n=1 Tax=Bradyrhizobium TaxID=374 RepID=UPI003966E183